MDKIESEIIKYYKEDLIVPVTFENAIKHSLDNNANMLYNKFNKIEYIKYIIAMLLISAISFNIVSFAYTYYKYKANNTIGYVANSTKQAIENGYIQNVDMDYTYCKGVGVKINYIVMSDYNLNVLFDFNFDNQNINNDFLILNDLIIYDENKNILFCYDTKTIKEFSKVNNLKWKSQDTSLNQYADGYSTQEIELDDNMNKILYKIRSLKGFPNSKKLYFSFSSIYDCQQEKEILRGTWNIELNLSEQFYNRDNIYYIIDESKDNTENINLIEAVTTDTLTRITIDTKQKVFNNIELYLEENNNIYTINNIEDTMYIQGKFVSATFSINKLQNLDRLKLIIKIDNKEEFIYLKRD